MLFATFFDAIAKGMHMQLIVDAHCRVFDAEGRAQRLLSELKTMMSVLLD
jgi:hypothetical protein